jgi:uncharacterized phage protein (TIGR01671 family)
MREIKFRAWDKKENKMQQVVQILYGHEASNYPLSVDFFRSVKSRLIKDIELMQYTGLKDKNGKEIYEGDIVMIYDARESESFPMFSEKVIFEKGKFMTEGEFDLYDTDNYSYELIGNIFENKELLK